MNALAAPRWSSEQSYIEDALSDLRVWTENECMIRPEEGGVFVPMLLTPPQEDALGSLLLARKHTNRVRIVHLKARQVMASTFYTSVFAQDSVRDSLSQGLVLAYQLKTTRHVMRMYRNLFEHLNLCAPMGRLVTKGIEQIQLATGAMIESASAKNVAGGHGLPPGVRAVAHGAGREG